MFSSLLDGFLSLVVPAALAQIPSAVVNSVGSSLPVIGGTFDDIVYQVIGGLMKLIGPAAYVVIAVTGLRMVIGQEDDARQKAKTILNVCIAGIILLQLIEPIMSAFFGGGNVVLNSPDAGVAVLSAQVLNIISWALGIAAVLAVTMIIISAVRAIATSGSEEGIANIRKTVFSAIAGLIILGLRTTIVLSFAVTGSPDPLVVQIAAVIQFVLKYVLICAIGVLIYGGLQILTSGGREEAVTKARELIVRSLIGVVIILLSYAGASFIVKIFGD
jgi:hypothetical protein